MIRIPRDFKDFLKLLNQNKVEYLIVGGYAVGLYGYPRATGDIDIWISQSEENAVKIIRVLKEFGFHQGEISTDFFLKDDQITRLGFPPLRIEILTTISGLSFPECFPEREIIEIDDIKINFLDFNNLLVNKKAAGRYKDLDDLENLTP